MKAITTILSVLALTSITLSAAEGDAKKPKADPEKVFAKKDTNGDGKLSKEEFTKGAKDATKAEAAFANKDKDKDGSVSKEEFTAPGKKKKDA